MKATLENHEKNTVKTDVFEGSANLGYIENHQKMKGKHHLKIDQILTPDFQQF